MKSLEVFFLTHDKAPEEDIMQLFSQAEQCVCVMIKLTLTLSNRRSASCSVETLWSAGT